MPNKTFITATPSEVVTSRVILEHQRRLTEEGSNLAMVTAKISEIAQEIERLKKGEPTAPTFNIARESILADIALGKADAADLKRSDDETAAAMKTHDAIVKAIREKVSPLESTSTGLRRKAGVLGREIESLRAEHRRLCLEYLMQQAEEAGKEYVAAATRAVKAADLVVMFASLHKRAGGENLIGDGIDSIDIPPLGVESTRGTLPPLDPASRTAAYDLAETEILESLKREGIAMPFPNADVAPSAKARVPGIEKGTPVKIIRPPETLRAADGTPLLDHAITEAEE